MSVFIYILCCIYVELTLSNKNIANTGIRTLDTDQQSDAPMLSHAALKAGGSQAARGMGYFAEREPGAARVSGYESMVAFGRVR